MAEIARPVPAPAEERATEETTYTQYAVSPLHGEPLPGVMDFIGAHVGGELAEERWR